MKNFFLILICFTSISAFSQKTDMPFDRWSIELGVGQAKGLGPFTPGYYSSATEIYSSIGAINNFEGGVRYMLSPKFGIKIDGAYSLLKQGESNGSLPFETKVVRIGLQMVLNLGRMMSFESFTKRFGILANAGFQVHQMTPHVFNGIEKGDAKLTEDNGGLIIGITPQFRITNSFALTANASYLHNFRQHWTWDGNQRQNDTNLTGSMLTVSVGVTAYLGKSDVHADWYSEETGSVSNSNANNSDLENLRNRLRTMETRMALDSDKDGIPDYLDGCPFEPGTKLNNGCPEKDTDGDGVLDKDDECVTIPGPVDNKGCPYSDKDGDKVADKDDACPEDQGPVSNKGCPRVDKKVKKVIDDLAKNIFFNSGKSDLSPRSITTLNKLKDILVQYPNVKFKVLGHTDDKGNFDKNMKLSDDRAAAVITWLSSKGIPTTNLSSEGFGSTKPISPNTTEAGRAANRRTEIEVVDED